MPNPSELFEVAQDGKSKFGDNLKLYSVGTFGVMESSNKLQFNTSGTIPRMTIDAAGFV